MKVDWKLDISAKMDRQVRHWISLHFHIRNEGSLKPETFTGSRKKLSRKDNLAIFRGISWFKDGVYKFVQKENTKAKGEKAKT